MKNTLSRRWITDRLRDLDAERDYAEIVRLSTLYSANAFQMAWFYAVNTPAAGLAPAVMDAILRGGTGSYIVEAEGRVHDSVDHMTVWLEHGAEAPATAASIEMVNKLHRHYAEEYREGFADSDDWIFILCLNATAVNSSLVSLGFAGFDEKQKRAVHILWSRLAAQFEQVTEGASVTTVARFPESYEAMEDVVRQYEARPWSPYAPGHVATSSAIEHFARTHFPRPLWFFGRALVTSFLSPAVIRSHSITPPSPVMRAIARGAMRSMIALASALPDSKESFTDRRRRLSAAGRAAESRVDTAVHRKVRGTVTPSLAPEFGGGASLCPHLASLERAQRVVSQG